MLPQDGEQCLDVLGHKVTCAYGRPEGQERACHAALPNCGFRALVPFRAIRKSAVKVCFVKFRYAARRFKER